MAAHLTTVCESNNQDLATGNVIFFLGVLFLSLYTICILYQNWVGLKKVRDQQRNDSSEENDVPLLIEISFSFMGNGIAMIGRWFIPTNNFLCLVVGQVLCSQLGWCSSVIICFLQAKQEAMISFFRSLTILSIRIRGRGTLFFLCPPMEFLSLFFQ
ncbi:hypothetical protein CRYUN_Cryun21dG0105400 [Craigia yunnanensis]